MSHTLYAKGVESQGLFHSGCSCFRVLLGAVSKTCEYLCFDLCPWQRYLRCFIHFISVRLKFTTIYLNVPLRFSQFYHFCRTVSITRPGTTVRSVRVVSMATSAWLARRCHAPAARVRSPSRPTSQSFSICLCFLVGEEPL